MLNIIILLYTIFHSVFASPQFFIALVPVITLGIILLTSAYIAFVRWLELSSDRGVAHSKLLSRVGVFLF
jgi:hypothetical protein